MGKKVKEIKEEKIPSKIDKKIAKLQKLIDKLKAKK
jgi:hypothetical protein